MKRALVLLALATSMNALALDLACFTLAPLNTSIGPVRAVTFTGVDRGEAVRASFPDQNAMTAFTEADGKFVAEFSNECDNHYNVTFPANDFLAILAGEIYEINGTVDYEGADEVSGSAFLRCRAL